LKKDLSPETKARLDGILNYIVRYKIKYGGATPSMLEIGRETGHGKTSIFHNLRLMERHGMIRFLGKNRNGIEIPGEKYAPPEGLDVR